LLNRGDILALDVFAGFDDGLLDGLLGAALDFLAVILHSFFDRVDQGIEAVASVDELLALFILSPVSLGFLLHALDLVFRKAARSSDANRLLLAGSQILGTHVDDAVGVDAEGDLDLRDSARSRRDADQVKAT